MRCRMPAVGQLADPGAGKDTAGAKTRGPPGADRFVRGGSMAERYNAAVEFVDRHLAEGRAEKVAFRDPRRSLTYGELHDQASRVGPALAALGIAPEHRVVMLMLDTVDFPVVFWGAIRAGIIPVPLNTLLAPDQYAYMLEDSRAPLSRLGAAAAGRRSRDRRLRAPRESRRRGSGAGREAPAARRSPDGGCSRPPSRPRPAPTRSPSGSTRRARPACRRASSTSIRA